VMWQGFHHVRYSLLVAEGRDHSAKATAQSCGLG
jgi:hypothetical protein